MDAGQCWQPPTLPLPVPGFFDAPLFYDSSSGSLLTGAEVKETYQEPHFGDAKQESFRKPAQEQTHSGETGGGGLDTSLTPFVPSARRGSLAASPPATTTSTSPKYEPSSPVTRGLRFLPPVGTESSLFTPEATPGYGLENNNNDDRSSPDHILLGGNTLAHNLADLSGVLYSGTSHPPPSMPMPMPLPQLPFLLPEQAQPHIPCQTATTAFTAINIPNHSLPESLAASPNMARNSSFHRGDNSQQNRQFPLPSVEQPSYNDDNTLIDVDRMSETATTAHTDERSNSAGTHQERVLPPMPADPADWRARLRYCESHPRKAELDASMVRLLELTQGLTDDELNARKAANLRFDRVREQRLKDRNNEAAKRSRQRKVQRIEEAERTITKLRADNTRLKSELQAERAKLATLRKQAKE